MQLLTTTKVYDIENDQTDLSFLDLVKNPPANCIIIDGNAGLGADWPAGIWKSINGAAVALAIISAPSTIKENWPIWKSIFDSITEKIMKYHGEYRIDRDTAQVIAIHHAVFHGKLDENKISVHMAVRHYYTSIAGYEDLLMAERVNMEWPEYAQHGTEEFSKGVRSNEEAAKQAKCRYIFGIEDGSNCLTIAIEQDGSILVSKSMDMKRDWG